MAAPALSIESAREISPALALSFRPQEEQDEFWDSLTEEEAEALKFSFDEFWARPKQILPVENYSLILALAGRGWGKTLTSTHWILKLVMTGKYPFIGLINKSLPDVRSIQIEGPSGILEQCPPALRPKYVKMPHPVLIFPNGTKVRGYSAQEPDGLRGASLFAAAADELCSWQFMDETWHNLRMAVREGVEPKILVTTTPRPQKLIRKIKKDPRAYVVIGSTRENYYAPAEWQEMLAEDYGQSRLARQELDAEILDDDSGLFKGTDIEKSRIKFNTETGDVLKQFWDLVHSMEEIVIALDPSGRGHKKADACGIVVIGKKGKDYYVFKDYTAQMSPHTWGAEVCRVYHLFQANAVIAETNYGGAMVSEVIRQFDPNLPIREVVGKRGKMSRAEGPAAICESGRIHFVGYFNELEEELTGYEQDAGKPSPNRFDAFVYGILHLAQSTESWMFSDEAWAYIAEQRGVKLSGTKGNISV